MMRRMKHFTAVAMIGALIFPMPFFAQAKQSQPAKAQKESQASASSPQPFISPEPRALNGGEKHTYPLPLKANDYVKLVVEQRGIDVVVRLIGPDGKVIQEVDSPNGIQGPELLSFISEKAGTYQIEVEAPDQTALAGKYDVKLETPRAATEQDQAEYEVNTLLVKAARLRQAGKYNECLPLATQALEKSEKAFGGEHLLVALSLNDLVVL
ncbi:MAG: hypothetical protein HY774_27525 [Acidobacteria bacterium]|nr:hypothetical protein [Acidobacteriota bacterium]